MTSETESALEADQEVVETEAEQVEASEAAKPTKGQVKDQPADDDGDEPEPEEISPAKARRERRKAEMDRVHREKAELSDKLAQSEARLRRLEDVSSKSAPPKEADFPSYEEYQANLAAYHSMKALDNRQREEVLEEADGVKKAISASEQARKNEIAANWQDQKAEASQRYADFETVFGPEVSVTAEMAEIIAGSDVGADIAYYLGSHRAEADQIARMSVLEQARRIGNIEARVSLPTANTNSQAPTPIRPVKGKATGNKSIDDMSMDEYAEARRSGKLK